MSAGHLFAAVGFPITASATVATMTTDTAGHATLTANRWYEVTSPYDMMVQISTDDTSATTGAGMRIPANTIYGFFLPADYIYLSFINKNADEGESAGVVITPKKP